MPINRPIMGVLRVFLFLSWFVVSVYLESDDSDKVSKGILQIINEAKKNGRQYEEEIKEIFEIIRKVVKNGFDPLGIPTLDPFKIDNLTLNPENPIVSGDLHLSKLEVKGLSSFIGQGNASDFFILVAFNIDFEPVEFVTNYEANLIFLLTDLFGEGSVKILFKNFYIHTTLKLGVKLESPFISEVQELTLQLKLPTIDVTITGLYNDEYLSQEISKKLTKTLTDLAEKESERVANILHNLIWPIIEEINKILGGNNESSINTDDIYKSLILLVIEEARKEGMDKFSK